MMKRLFWIFFGIISLLGIVVYWGNVLVIGDHLGRLFGGGGLPNPYVMYTWDVLVGLAPFLLLAWVVTRNILGYGELNLREVCEGEDEEKMDQVMGELYEQEEDSDCVLDKAGLRSQCGYLLRNGSRAEKADFLREYFRQCDKEARKKCHQYAIFAAVSVVLSPKSAGDTLALLVWQCRIISATLRIYGGRPSVLGVVRLYLRVLMHSFLVGSIEEVMDQFAFGAVDIKMLSIATQAVAAIATCVRTASLTRYYLENGIGSNQKEALHASMEEIPGGIVEVLTSEEMKIAGEKFLHCSVQVTKVVTKSGLAGVKKLFKHVISLFSSEEPPQEEDSQVEAA
ncbi:MAG: DUF697 domain-containing protein [Oligosphaeraceae bacterium]